MEVDLESKEETAKGEPAMSEGRVTARGKEGILDASLENLRRPLEFGSTASVNGIGPKH